jgi:hypothetical protein
MMAMSIPSATPGLQHHVCRLFIALFNPLKAGRWLGMTE